MSAQIAAERKKGPGLGKKDLNIHALLLTSYRFKIAVFYEKIAAAITTTKGEAGLTVNETDEKTLSSYAIA
ncbi:hypothetical protein MUU46_05925 [Scandinavium sp. TWS1a]|uniref:hypothetical protein n=1 Tax=Scandinavium tedordense TaxID=2926521 RepID=UPI0021658B2F|nr:hypothetical protein [Scandinavium tedordense]MCS2169861.1 hypothetical protein [Scandinavium tedordense]